MNELASILLVEDDPRDVELTVAALEENKLANSLSVVSDGAEAIDYLHRAGKFADIPPGNPLVVFLDLKLPKVSGIEVLQHIRNDPILSTTPVVILTSSAEERDLVKGYELGVNAYVVKPVDFDSFVSVVRELGMFWAVINRPPPNSQGGVNS